MKRAILGYKTPSRYCHCYCAVVTVFTEILLQILQQLLFYSGATGDSGKDEGRMEGKRMRMRMRIKWRYYYGVIRVVRGIRLNVKTLGFTGDDAHKNGREGGEIISILLFDLKV